MSVLNAYAVITATHKQKIKLQVSDSWVPFAIPVKTDKDKLSNALVGLMKELGVKCSD